MIIPTLLCCNYSHLLQYNNSWALYYNYSHTSIPWIFLPLPNLWLSHLLCYSYPCLRFYEALLELLTVIPTFPPHVLYLLPFCSMIIFIRFGMPHVSVNAGKRLHFSFFLVPGHQRWCVSPVRRGRHGEIRISICSSRLSHGGKWSRENQLAISVLDTCRKKKSNCIITRQNNLIDKIL